MTIAAEHERRLTCAMAEQQRPLIHSLAIVNDGAALLPDAVCRISSPDGWFQNLEIELGEVPPGATVQMNPIRPNYNLDLLRRQEFPLPCTLQISVKSRGETVAAKDCDLVAGGAESVASETAGRGTAIPPPSAPPPPPESSPEGRVAVWARKLLDLSPRNRLLNARPRSDILWLQCPDPARLEDRLASGVKIQLCSVAEAAGAPDGSQMRELTEREFAAGRLVLPEGIVRTEKMLRKLKRLCRADLEEIGAHTLYVAIGFLRWTDPEKRTDGKRYDAPLIMVPVDFCRTGGGTRTDIVKRDDDTVVNTTLVHFLRTRFRAELPGLDPLPLDEDGLDVPNIFRVFRECTKAIPDMEVVEEIAVGRFTFGKFAMWRDLTANAGMLERNRLVAHLISGSGVFPDRFEPFDSATADAILRPSSLYCPVAADSSQLAAVHYSAQGKSFVLHGPPGTGKSQTITNLIAHNLAIGRRVLFVSEKKAALDVVHQRLKEVGLEPFCLELHSNKATKTSVMQQFRSSLAVVAQTDSGEWARTAAKLETLQKRLAAYVDALHAVYPNGISAYDCFSSAFRPDPPPPADWIGGDCLADSAAELEAREQALRQLAVEIGNVPELQALTAIPDLKCDEWSDPFESRLRAAAAELAASARRLAEATEAVAASLSLEPPTDEASLAVAVDALETLRRERHTLAAPVGRISPRLVAERTVKARAWQRSLAEAEKDAGQALDALKGWAVDRLELVDVPLLRDRIAGLLRRGAIVRFFGIRLLLREFSPVRRAPGRLTLPELEKGLDGIERLGQARRTLKELQAVRLGEADGGEAIADTVPLTEEQCGAIGGALAAWEAYAAARREMAECAEREADDSAPATAISAGERILAHIGMLRSVMRYRPFRRAAERLGLAKFAHALETGEIGTDGAVETYRRAYMAKMLRQIEAVRPELSGFFGRSREADIEQFRQLTEELLELSKRAIFARIAARYPGVGGGFSRAESLQLGRLKREVGKKRTNTTIRSLLAEAGDLVIRYKPCFLMSPLSVAQFLDGGLEPFDLVVFDEASQIEVSDAIGAMARGRQVVVVGDPQQMPPASFFTGGGNGGEEEAVQDAESILVECMNAGLPQTYLNWHYRSRHESLIAFSNRHYYGDGLNSFPSVSETARLGIRFRRVKNGNYRNGVNPNEAKAVVDYVADCVKSGDFRRRPRSIGVVTFNQKQQELIEDLFDARCGDDPELREALFGAAGEGEAADAKRFFVRNLENVQGDEADLIVFSVTFGPDESGRVSMNFGPINNEGGERRLNVAVTRAREQMVVFSTIRHADIRRDERLARGVHFLREFLKYAETGFRTGFAGGAEGESGLVRTVAEVVESRGYRVVRNVGASGCKIDLAVVNPHNEREYVLGIEFDGPAYAAQKTVRDRDVLRSSVLSRGGWKLCRVWSADWLHDRAGAEERLVRTLEELRPAPPEADADESDGRYAEITVDETDAGRTVEPAGVEERREESAEVQVEELAADAPAPEMLISLPLTEAALSPVRSPIALRLDGSDFRIVSSWKDCYLALCELLMALDADKFESLPETPQFAASFVRNAPPTVRSGCYPGGYGRTGEVGIKTARGKSCFLGEDSVVHRLLAHFGIDPSRVTVRK